MFDRSTPKKLSSSDPFSPSNAGLIIILEGSDFKQSQLGEKFTLHPDGNIIGNQPDCQIQLGGTGVPRKAKIYYDAEEKIWLIESLVESSISRVYLNGLFSNFALLQDGDNLQLGKQGALFGFLQGISVNDSLSDVMNKRISKKPTQANDPALTQITHQTAFEQVMKEKVGYCRKHEISLSAIFLGIKSFAQVNETTISLGKEEVFFAILAKIQEQIRPLDTCVHLNEDIIAILLQDTTYEQAMFFAERLYMFIESTVIEQDDQFFQASVALGVNTLEPSWSLKQFLKESLRCLQKAKKSKRHSIVGYQELCKKKENAS